MIETYYRIIKLNKTALTFGFFDGFHKGHKKLITALINSANLTGAKSVVLVLNDDSDKKFNLLKICRFN